MPTKRIKGPLEPVNKAQVTTNHVEEANQEEDTCLGIVTNQEVEAGLVAEVEAEEDSVEEAVAVVVMVIVVLTAAGLLRRIDVHIQVTSTAHSIKSKAIQIKNVLDKKAKNRTETEAGLNQDKLEQILIKNRKMMKSFRIYVD